MPSPRHIEFLIYCVTFTWNWFTALPDPVTALSKLPFGWGGAQFWSICVEEQFYLVAPILIVLVPTLGRSLVAWVLICAVLIASQNEFAPISLGVLAAVTNKTFGDWHQTRIATIILSAMCLLCTVFMTASYFLISPFFAISVVLLLARRARRLAWDFSWAVPPIRSTSTTN
jgi:peptidoglycan/LPS O-acetylase OafA/YrhL